MTVAFALLLTSFAPGEARLLKYTFKAGDEVRYINTNLRTTTYKKAIVTLAEGQSLQIFEGV